MSATFCSEALRIIGRDLEFRGIKTFLLRCAAALYVVEAGYQSPPAPTAFTLHYTSDDITRLARETRDRESAVQDFLSLSQILSTIGSYVASKGARLLSISNGASTESTPIIKTEYETIQGDRVVEDLTGSAIYELCVGVYKLRGTSGDSIRYTRFSALQDKS